MKHLPGTRTLRILETALREQNFTSAAAHLRLTPAAVSHQVTEFENQLGLRLFKRNKRSLELTAAGERMFAAVVNSLDMLAKASGEAKTIDEFSELRITAIDTIANRWLLPRLNTFLEQHPKVDVHVQVTTQPWNLPRDDFDVAFRWGDGNFPLAQHDPLFEHQLLPVCSPEYLRTAAKIETVESLLDHRLIHVDWSRNVLKWPDWKDWFELAGIEYRKVASRVHFTETGYAIDAALNGYGIALGDSCMIADDIATGRLVAVNALGIPGPRGFGYHMVCPDKKFGRSVVRIFREWAFDEAAATRSAVDNLRQHFDLLRRNVPQFPKMPE